MINLCNKNLSTEKKNKNKKINCHDLFCNFYFSVFRINRSMESLIFLSLRFRTLAEV